MPKSLLAEKPPLVAGLRQEWEDMFSSDLVIRCARGTSIPAHKIVLASLAPEMLKAALLEHHHEESATVIAPEANPESLRDFLQKVYQGGEEEASLPEDLLYLGIDLPYQMDGDEFDDESDDDSVQSDDDWVNEGENQGILKPVPKQEAVLEEFPQMNKRKRGRPRKTDTSDKIISISKPKRPRGRPRKHDCENNVESYWLDDSSSYENNDYYEEKLELEMNQDGEWGNETDFSTSTAIPKRKRGRPRKGEERIIVAGPKRPRGRPRKYLGLEEEREFPKEEREFPKRRRGRPRKYDIDGNRPTRCREPKKETLPSKYQCILDQFLRPKGSKKSYECLKCNKGVKVRGYIEHYCCLAKHLMDEHEQVYEQVLKEANFCVEEVTDEINKIIEEENLNDHNIDSDPSERTCKDCGKMFTSRQGMLKHWTAMHSKHNLRVCHVCGEEFSSIVQLRRHGHGYEKPFMCSFCGDTFTKKHHRDTHERVHTGDKDWACSYCPKKFVTKQRLKLHIRVHTGEKPYQCEVCSRTFARKTHLTTHSVIHTGARPHQCQYCKQLFRHLSTKHKHPCPERERQLELRQQVVRKPIAPINPDIQLYRKPSGA